MIVNIAVVITCHNRKEKTLAALEKLYTQVGLDFKYKIKIFLVDDGSSDGTTAAVKEFFSEVHIINGSGKLYWNRGMWTGFKAALNSGSDYYLWLNDDTQLKQNALDILINSANSLPGELNLVVGSVQDNSTKMLTYGGLKKASWWHPLKFKRVEPSSGIQEIDTMNGNCVLISKKAAQIVGNLDYRFTHSMGDIDYGLRAKKLGCQVVLAPDFVGSCQRNRIEGTWQDSNLNFFDRIRKKHLKKGLSLTESFIFFRRHGNFFSFFCIFLPYFRILSTNIRRKK